LAQLITRPDTAKLAVAYIASSAVAIIAALGVSALRLLVAIMEAQSTLIDIRTLCVRPLRIMMGRTIQSQRAIASTVAEIALHANTFDGIVAIEAPTAAQGSQTRGTVSMLLAGLALLL